MSRGTSVQRPRSRAEVGAGRRLACPRRGAVAIQAHRRGVVLESAAAGLDRRSDEELYGLTGMLVGALEQHRPEVDLRGAPLQHAVRDEQESVACLERKRL